MEESVKFVKKENYKKIGALLKDDLEKVFSEGDKVAVKLHMGEPGNKNHIKPEFVAAVVKVLKIIGTKPFLFDSPVIYGGPRGTIKEYHKAAEKNGFDIVDCPIIISNFGVPYKTKNLEVEVCEPLVKADGVLALSHVKGHGCSGFGGAVKNLGMGGVTMKTKKDVHEKSQPLLIGECTGCEICKDGCPFGTIEMFEGKMNYKAENCWGCGVCIESCPRDCLEPKIASFDTLLAEGAYAVMQSVKKAFFVNYLFDITKMCDCCVDPGPIIADNLGIVFGESIINVDKASLDLVEKAMGKDVFFEANKKDPLNHVNELKRLLSEIT